MGNKSQINMICDSYVSLEDAIFQHYIADNYSFPIVNVSIKMDSLKDFVNEIKETYSNCTVDDVELNSTSKFFYLEDKEKFFIEMNIDNKNESYNVSIYGKEYSHSNDVWKIVQKYEPGGNGVYLEVDNYTIAENGSLHSRREFKEYADIYDASKDYYPYLDTDILFKKYALSNESIMLLVGQPGVGKTKLVALLEKYMFDNPELFAINKDNISNETYFKVAYVKNEDILAKDSFWDDLNNENYNLIFLDDADNCLLPRDSEVYTSEDVNRKKFLSQLLSFTDGISTNETKIVITTNRSVDDIDIAVLRRGRTFEILELQPLTFEEGKAIWEKNKLDVADYMEFFKNKKDIIPSELGAEIAIRLKYRDNNAEDPGEYLLRDGISQLNTYRNKKRKIGL